MGLWVHEMDSLARKSANKCFFITLGREGGEGGRAGVP